MSSLAILAIFGAGITLGLFTPKPLRARDPLGWACLVAAALMLCALVLVNAGCPAAPYVGKDPPPPPPEEEEQEERACIVYDPSPVFGPCAVADDCGAISPISPCLRYDCDGATGECVPRAARSYCDGINGESWLCEGHDGQCCEPEPVK